MGGSPFWLPHTCYVWFYGWEESQSLDLVSNSSNEFSLWLLMCFCFLLLPVRLFKQENTGQQITWWIELHNNNLRDLKKSLSIFGGCLVSHFIPLIWRGILLPLLESGMGLRVREDIRIFFGFLLCFGDMAFWWYCLTMLASDFPPLGIWWFWAIFSKRILCRIHLPFFFGPATNIH